MEIDYSAMAFPKKKWSVPEEQNAKWQQSAKGKRGKGQQSAKRKKKRKRHAKSILQDKDDKRCFLSMLLDRDYREQYVEEHHIIFGEGLRELSEAYGLKVNLSLKYHRIGPLAVHNNHEMAELLMRIAQEKFKEVYPDLDWMEIFPKNYLEVEDETT